MARDDSNAGISDVLASEHRTKSAPARARESPRTPTPAYLSQGPQAREVEDAAGRAVAPAPQVAGR